MCVSKEEDKLLKCGEPVRFGLLTSLFRLESSRLVICSSGLSSSDSALVKTTIESLSGKKPDEKNYQCDLKLKFVCLWKCKFSSATLFLEGSQLNFSSPKKFVKWKQVKMANMIHITKTWSLVQIWARLFSPIFFIPK